MGDLATQLTATLQEHGVVPDIIPSLTSISPKVFFSASYPGDASDRAPGSVLLKGATQQEPEIRLLSAQEGQQGTPLDTNKSYTLVMTDPDAPSRANPKFGQWRHWVITGLKVPNNVVSGGMMQKTVPSTTPYFGPGPPPGTGHHRYVFLLFEEPTAFVIPDDAPEHDGEFTSRRSWNAMKFAEKYGLTLVGVDFFLCEDS